MSFKKKVHHLCLYIEAVDICIGMKMGSYSYYVVCLSFLTGDGHPAPT